jgi:hypothetical protein
MLYLQLLRLLVVKGKAAGPAPLILPRVRAGEEIIREAAGKARAYVL